MSAEIYDCPEWLRGILSTYQDPDESLDEFVHMVWGGLLERGTVENTEMGGGRQLVLLIHAHQITRT